MYKYKTEMHCHTKESSACGQVSAKDVVNAYIEAGYDSLIITDHFGFKPQSSSGGKNFDVNNYLEGYLKAKKIADGRINIILGMEICLSESANEYLVYGINEEFIRKNPDMYKLGHIEFCDFMHENGFLVYQAHPFRNRMTIINPAPLDGIEVFNAHPRHDSRNSVAQLWAELYNMKMISGSDTHQMQDVGRGGISTKTEIKNEKELLDILKSEDYMLITC